MRAFPIAALGSFPGIGFNRPSGTYPPPPESIPALKRRAIIELSLWDKQSGPLG